MRLRRAYMCYVNVDREMILDFYFAQTNSFAAEPVAVMDFMDVAVQRPFVEHHVAYEVSREHTDSRAHYTTGHTKFRVFHIRVKLLFTMDVSGLNVQFLPKKVVRVG